jgi:monovalent cation/proton antiporter MnhG/PhaG subunit
MSENLLVDLLLGVGVGAQLLCCVGVVVMRTVFDRLHYAAAGASVGPFSIVAALLIREGLSAEGMEALAAVVLLFLASPVLVNATARAARKLDYGQIEAQAEEKVD